MSPKDALFLLKITKKLNPILIFTQKTQGFSFLQCFAEKLQSRPFIHPLVPSFFCSFSKIKKWTSALNFAFACGLWEIFFFEMIIKAKDQFKPYVRLQSLDLLSSLRNAPSMRVPFFIFKIIRVKKMYSSGYGTNRINHCQIMICNK